MAISVSFSPTFKVADEGAMITAITLLSVGASMPAMSAQAAVPATYKADTKNIELIAYRIFHFMVAAGRLTIKTFAEVLIIITSNTARGSAGAAARRPSCRVQP